MRRWCSRRFSEIDGRGGFFWRYSDTRENLFDEAGRRPLQLVSFLNETTR